MDFASMALVVAATGAALLIPFVVVPEILERRGHDPRSRFVRGLSWVSFIAIIFVPAAASGFLFSVGSPVDWAIFGIAMLVAILFDYYRLNPKKVPWARTRT
jgi:hypothetical protein